MPSLATNLAEVPALLASCAPFSGFSSTQWTLVPSGISFNFIELPTLISQLSADITSSPTFNLEGAIIYLLSPSLYKRSAI